jgi:hypothetical protein
MVHLHCDSTKVAGRLILAVTPMTDVPAISNYQRGTRPKLVQ